MSKFCRPFWKESSDYNTVSQVLPNTNYLTGIHLKKNPKIYYQSHRRRIDLESDQKFISWPKVSVFPVTHHKMLKKIHFWQKAPNHNTPCIFSIRTIRNMVQPRATTISTISQRWSAMMSRLRKKKCTNEQNIVSIVLNNVHDLFHYWHWLSHAAITIFCICFLKTWTEEIYVK